MIFNRKSGILYNESRFLYIVRGGYECYTCQRLVMESRKGILQRSALLQSLTAV